MGISLMQIMYWDVGTQRFDGWSFRTSMSSDRGCETDF